MVNNLFASSKSSLVFMLKKGSNFFTLILIVFTPILFAHSSTFLKLLLIKSFSNIFNNSIDHNPKILCLLLFDLTKYNNIIPCGIKDKGITNLKEIKNLDYKKLEDIIIKNFTKNLEN